MDRGPSGHFEPIAPGSATLDAFVPDPLPSDPPLAYEHLRPAFEEASRSIMRLYAPRGLSLPRVAFFISLRHREAIFSTRLPGVRVSTSDSFRMDPHRLQDTPRSVIMATQLRIAGDEGSNRIEGGAPVSVALIRELHATMFSVFADIGALGSGEFRTGSGWPLDASAPPTYVPAPARQAPGGSLVL